MALPGLRKVVDFQDLAYGTEYLDRVEALRTRDDAAHGFELTREAAKYIANAMAYDDVIRVADLKTTASRFSRLRGEVGATDEQVLQTTEFMHPRMEEVLGTLPAGLGLWLERREGLVRSLDKVVNRGRRVRTDTLGWFVPLYVLGGLKRWRRGMLRHGREMAHLEAWVGLALPALAANYEAGVEALRNRRLVKGYSDTHARGQAKFDKVMAMVAPLSGRADGAAWIRRLREAALADEEGRTLDGALRTVAGILAEAPAGAGVSGRA
jgi:indolepyruvate ferredoxin oxidoreductase beta subunit